MTLTYFYLQNVKRKLAHGRIVTWSVVITNLSTSKVRTIKIGNTDEVVLQTRARGLSMRESYSICVLPQTSKGLNDSLHPHNYIIIPQLLKSK